MSDVSGKKRIVLEEIELLPEIALCKKKCCMHEIDFPQPSICLF